MTIENFTTYTEVDPGGIRIEVTSSRVTWTILRRNVDGYVYKDYNAGFFSGDFIFQLTFRVTGGNNGGLANFWALANIVDDWVGIDTANGDGLSASIKRNDITDVPSLTLNELDGGTAYNSGVAFEISDDTDYYITVERDESIGTYGTMTMFTYSNADRTTLINTQAITLHTSKKDYRYLYACQSYNSGTTQSVSAFTENMTIVENWGGDFIKQIGVSSLPLTADKIYDRVAGETPVTKRLTMAKVTKIRQPVTRSFEPEFDAVGVI